MKALSYLKDEDTIVSSFKGVLGIAGVSCQATNTEACICLEARNFRLWHRAIALPYLEVPILRAKHEDTVRPGRTA